MNDGMNWDEWGHSRSLSDDMNQGMNNFINCGMSQEMSNSMSWGRCVNPNKDRNGTVSEFIPTYAFYLLLPF